MSSYKFHKFFLHFCWAFLLLLFLEIFSNLPFKAVIISKLPVFAFTAAILTLLSFLNYNRFTQKDSFDFQITDWDTVWSQFLTFMEKQGFKPLCQMENTFYFEQKGFFLHFSASITKVSSTTVRITYPQAIKSKVVKDFGVYKSLHLTKNQI